MSSGWIQGERLFPYDKAIALSPGSSITSDVIIDKTFPAVGFIGTEPNALYTEVREISGDLWITTNATYEPAVPAIPNQWTQNNPAISSYATVFRGNGSVQRLTALPGSPAPIPWAIVSSTDAMGELAITPGTLTTASQIPYAASATWNAPGQTMAALRININDTSSAASSLLQDFQVAGTSKWSVRKDGTLVAGTIPFSAITGASGIVTLSPGAAQTGFVQLTGDFIGGNFQAAGVFKTNANIGNAIASSFTGGSAYVGIGQNGTNGSTDLTLVNSYAGGVMASFYKWNGSAFAQLAIVGSDGSWNTGSSYYAATAASVNGNLTVAQFGIFTHNGSTPQFQPAGAGGLYITNAANSVVLYSFDNSGNFTAVGNLTTTNSVVGGSFAMYGAAGATTLFQSGGSLFFCSYTTANNGFAFVNYNNSLYAPILSGSHGVSGNVTASGFVSGSQLIANGGRVDVAGDIGTATSSAAGRIWFGQGGSAAQIDYNVSIGSTFFLNASAYVNGAFTVNGSVTANGYTGSGAGLTSIPQSALNFAPTRGYDTGNNNQPVKICGGESTTSTGGNIVVTMPFAYATYYIVTCTAESGAYIMSVVKANLQQFTATATTPGVGGISGVAFSWIAQGY